MKSSNLIRLLVLDASLNYVLISLPLLVAPTWFFDNIGTFGVFNRHYLFRGANNPTVTGV